MKNLKKIVIRSIQKLELDIEMLVDSITKDSSYTECRDTKDLKESLIFFIEPIRLYKKPWTISYISNPKTSVDS